MLASATIPTGSWISPFRSKTFLQGRKPMAERGNVSAQAEWQHLSLLVYAVPSERVRKYVPQSFELEEFVENRQEKAWVSVVSFLDHGTQSDGSGAFEQSNYRLHVWRDGAPAHWLLGSSLGSLSAVGARNFWTLPWHLSAMEFHTAFDANENRYRQYRLHTQSNWGSAHWSLEDSGKHFSLTQTSDVALPASLSGTTFRNFFARRGESVGLYRTQHQNLALTRAQVLDAKCESLEQMGILTRAELQNPVLAALQHSNSCQLFYPTVIGTPQDGRVSAKQSRPQLAFA